jgi:hypothetical protein
VAGSVLGPGVLTTKIRAVAMAAATAGARSLGMRSWTPRSWPLGHVARLDLERQLDQASVPAGGEDEPDRTSASRQTGAVRTRPDTRWSGPGCR